MYKKYHLSYRFCNNFDNFWDTVILRLSAMIWIQELPWAKIKHLFRIMWTSLQHRAIVHVIVHHIALNNEQDTIYCTYMWTSSGWCLYHKHRLFIKCLQAKESSSVFRKYLQARDELTVELETRHWHAGARQCCTSAVSSRTVIVIFLRQKCEVCT